MKKRCNDFDNAFSAIEFGMCKMGVWPLQKNDVFFDNVRWYLVTTVNLLVAMSLLMEICMSCGDASTTYESFLVLNASIHAMCNCLFPKIHRKKLAKNVNAAMEDWSSTSTMENEKFREIMRLYARVSKFIGMSQLILGFAGCCVYFVSILFIQKYQTDTESNGTVNRRYVIPATCIFENVSYTRYKIIILVQMLQAFTLLLTQTAVDIFFFAIVLHLCGQLDILKIRLSNFIEKESVTKKHDWKEFNEFVERHCRLISLADNLENSFNLSIMVQLLMNAVLIALTGFKFILALKSRNSVETMKTFMFMQFTIFQSFLYACAGDLLGGHSEDMFHTLWQTQWYDLPSSMIKSFAFVMMRTKQPLRISAGKFIHVSRITWMDVMKAAASYMSFLQYHIVPPTSNSYASGGISLEVNLKKMAIDEVVWTSDAAYALGTLKRITWITGTWPLQEGIFPRIRFGIVLALGLGVLVSLLMEIQLSCGSTDENLDFLGLIAGTIAGLTKVIFLKIHQKDLGLILSSALKDWISTVDGTTEKDIMRRYARRANLVYRAEISSGVIIVTAMILDAVPSPDSSIPTNNETMSVELVKRIPLRTMCAFGDMSDSTYWTVFAFQSFQLMNAAIIDLGNDCFIFGVAMYLCGQFDVLTCLRKEFVNRHEEDRDRKIEEFVERHSYLLDLARRLQDTLDTVLAVLLMSDGLHICLLGIQVIVLLQDNEIIPLVKATVAFVLVLGQLFLYSYIGDNLSSSSLNIHEVIYDCPWYEYPSNIIRNLMFVMARAYVPVRITAGKFYAMNIDSFKDILKASFSYFSVLRIMFEE